MSSDAVSTIFETRGALEGDAFEGDPLDAGLFDEPFDGIRGDLAREPNLLRRYTPLHTW